MRGKERVARLERKQPRPLYNGGMILHWGDETDEESRELYEKFPEREGYKHLWFDAYMRDV